MNKIIGSKSSTQYTLNQVIGQGSFGKVYLSGEYAVKQISLDLPPYLKSSLQTEIKILKQFKHPNIVSLMDVIYEPKHVYLVMEYCPMDMQKYMKKVKIDQAKSKRILQQIIAGFSQLVDKGIIHRDLKPANILVNNKGEFKLADFGFAKYVDHFDSKLLHSIVGTPLYMAPQILKKSKYTTKCDIWSIGFIFYELLMSKVPWTGSSQNQLYNNIVKKPLEIPNYISEWSANLLRRMLVVNENDRIGWDELIKVVLAGDKSSNNNSKGSQRQNSMQKNLSGPVSHKNLPQNNFMNNQNSNMMSVKVSDLISLFQLQLLEYFSESLANKMVTDKNYRFSAEQLSKIKKVLGNFSQNYQTFIENYFNLRN